MKTVTATEAQNNFGDLLMNAQSHPVSITRNGKEKGVLLSSEDYQDLKVKSLQSAIDAGLNSGVPTPLNMDEIKQKARMALNAKS
ncbi:MAG: prevent-host-death family protein [Alteromonadaceae bacterium]|nr:MAG: prevent-host-death family protein [Alteromonadaceae bacterium]